MKSKIRKCWENPSLYRLPPGISIKLQSLYYTQHRNSRGNPLIQRYLIIMTLINTLCPDTIHFLTVSNMLSCHLRLTYWQKLHWQLTQQNKSNFPLLSSESDTQVNYLSSNLYLRSERPLTAPWPLYLKCCEKVYWLII